MIIIKEKDLSQNKLEEINNNDIICYLPNDFDIISDYKLIERIKNLFANKKELLILFADIDIWYEKEKITYTEYNIKIFKEKPFFIRKVEDLSVEDFLGDKYLQRNMLSLHIQDPAFIFKS